MLKAHQDLSFRIGTHHCNYLQTHEYIKKEESRRNSLLLPPNYDLLRHNIERQKEFTGFNFRYQVEHARTHIP